MPIKVLALVLPVVLILCCLPGRPAATVAPAAPDLTIRDVSSGSIIYAGSAGGYMRMELHGLYHFQYRAGHSHYAKYVGDFCRAVLVEGDDSTVCAHWGEVKPVEPLVSDVMSSLLVLACAGGIVYGVVRRLQRNARRSSATPADHPPATATPATG